MLGFNKHDAVLTFNLLKMNVRDRYLGSAMGSFWAIANPLFLLGVYTFVFGFIFKVRLPGADTTLDYVIWLISGYGPWIATTEALVSATTSVVGAAGMVKNIVFKTELLPVAASLLGLISLTVSLVFLLILKSVVGAPPSWHMVWLPLVVVVHFMFVGSLGFWLSALNVFYRDLSQALPNLLTVLMFMTPIFYSIDSMPAAFKPVAAANPLYVIAAAYRSILVDGSSPGLPGLGYVFVLSGLVGYSGLAAFRRVKGRFDSAL